MDIQKQSGAGGVRRRSFAAEDLLLYIFGLLFLATIYMFFTHSLEQISSFNLLESSQLQTSQVSGDQAEILFLNAQLKQTAVRYQAAISSLAANSTRKSMAFLVGTLLALMGCFIVIRGVRDSSTSADMEAAQNSRFKLTTASPGVAIAFLGCAVIVASVLSKDTIELTDANLQQYRNLPFLIRNLDQARRGQEETVPAISARISEDIENLKKVEAAARRLLEQQEE